MRASVAVLLVLVMAAASGCGERTTGTTDTTGGVKDAGRDSPGTGDEGGDCYPNSTCNAGLACLGGTCTRQNPDGNPLPPDKGPPAKDGPGRKDGLPNPQDLRVTDGTPEATVTSDSTTPADTVSPPDAALPDTTPPVTCNPPGNKRLQFQTSSVGDWRVALEAATTYKAITIPGAPANQAAAIADYNVSLQQVAGFVVTRPNSVASAGALATSLVTDLSTQLAGTVSLVDAGVSSTTHDNFAAVTGIVVRVVVPSASDVSLQRNNVLGVLLGQATANLGGLPTNWGVPGTDFILRFAAVRRGSTAVIIGAVTGYASDNDVSKATKLISTDLASATGLARASGTTDDQCENTTLTQPISPVDIIWVIDESGSMTAKRANIAANAKTFFTLAQQRGLDFRMGVTNVVNPTGSFAQVVGKFCSRISANTQDLGGVDRFLLPTEQAIFESCVNNPPGYEGGLEHGLLNAREAVKKHLPRAANDPSKIRTGAQLVVIIVTDEVPQSLSATIGFANFNVCTLPAATQTSVDTALKPTFDLFDGTTTAGAKVNFFQMIGGTCNNSCSAQVAHGYKEVAARYNGAVYDVCQANLGPSITKIINDIQTAASAVKLKLAAVSASVAVAVDGTTVPRSLLKGFNYTPASRALGFTGGTTIKVGSVVKVSYKTWK